MRNDNIEQKDQQVAKPEERGESRGKQGKELNILATPNGIEILRGKTDLLEEILSRPNMFMALERVTDNDGCPGVDGMTVQELPEYLKQNWLKIKTELFEGKYKPNKIKGVEIPKAGGGKRELGIPTVIDRLIQQAIAQVLQGYIDDSFHARSYGYRPERSAHQALDTAVEELRAGKEIMVDLDIEKFFARVNHDRLMSKLRTLIGDQRVLNLIRSYLNAGKRSQGVDQGGPLSPLLSNIYLDELDQELTKRKLSFTRYADDLVVFVKSERAAKRVTDGIKKFLSQKLKLSVNDAKSGIGKKVGYLGFMISREGLTIKSEKVKAFKDKIRELTKIRGGRALTQILKDLRPIINGWGNYFAPYAPRECRSLDGWIRRRIRACYYGQLKNGKTRLYTFIKAGIGYNRAYRCAFSSRGEWHNSRGDVMQQVLSNKLLKVMRLTSLIR